jgi:hypothetical protein
MTDNVIYIQNKIDEYFGSKWAVTILNPHAYGAWAYWVYDDNIVFLQNYEKLR